MLLGVWLQRLLLIKPGMWPPAATAYCGRGLDQRCSLDLHTGLFVDVGLSACRTAR